MKAQETVYAKPGVKETVTAFIKALNNHRYEEARGYVNDTMTFTGVLGARNGADAYFDDMERMRLEYDIRKLFVEGEEACVLYDVTMSGKKIFCCGWYKLQNGKINSLRVVFDPRPVLNN